MTRESGTFHQPAWGGFGPTGNASAPRTVNVTHVQESPLVEGAVGWRFTLAPPRGGIALGPVRGAFKGFQY